MERKVGRRRRLQDLEASCRVWVVNRSRRFVGLHNRNFVRERVSLVLFQLDWIAGTVIGCGFFRPRKRSRGFASFISLRRWILKSSRSQALQYCMDAIYLRQANLTAHGQAQ